MSDNAKIVLQYGEGNFLRGFADDLLERANSSGHTNVKVAVVSPRFRNNSTIKALKAQNGRYHVCEQGLCGPREVCEVRVVSCIDRTISPLDEKEAYEALILDPDLRFVVSNSTEAGLTYAPDNIASDCPESFPGKIASMLLKRFRHFNAAEDKGLIFLPCELVAQNGRLLRALVLRHAREANAGPDFEKWVNDSCYFCDTLVDRIVPGRPATEFPADDTDFKDEAAVCVEPYYIWVIGGDGMARAKEELPLDRAGLNVVFSDNINAYRERKVRILNGSHTAMAAVGLVRGFKTVGEFIGDAEGCKFIDKLISKEIIPTISSYSPEELQLYKEATLDRFRNRFVEHRLESIALNSISKWSTRNLPAVKDYCTKFNMVPQHQAKALAALLVLYSSLSGFQPTDNAEAVRALQNVKSRDELISFAGHALGKGMMFGEDITAECPMFSEAVACYINEFCDE